MEWQSSCGSEGKGGSIDPARLGERGKIGGGEHELPVVAIALYHVTFSSGGAAQSLGKVALSAVPCASRLHPASRRGYPALSAFHAAHPPVSGLVSRLGKGEGRKKKLALVVSYQTTVVFESRYTERRW